MDVKNVEIITAPGAKYNAEVNAVIRIKTLKPQGDGFSLMATSQTWKNNKWNNYDDLTLKYRKGGLEAFATVALDNGHFSAEEDVEQELHIKKDKFNAQVVLPIRSNWTQLQYKTGVSYDFNTDHSLGLSFSSQKLFYNKFKTDMRQTYLKNGAFYGDVLLKTDIDELDKPVWELNTYYVGKVGKLGIDLNATWLRRDSENHLNQSEQSVELGNRTITTLNLGKNEMVAGKLVLTYPIGKGELCGGSEVSTTLSQGYNYNVENIIPEADYTTDEYNIAGFAEYELQLGMWHLNAGLRYEHLKNDYFNFGVREDEVCRNYGDWFPTATLSAPIGKMQLSLSYRRDIQRPAYSNLTSSTIYVNRYTYQSGNPYLKPTYNHSLVLNAAYQWANLTVGYGRMKNGVTMSTEPFPGSEDPLISLVRPINSADDYNQFELSLSARPTIGCWHPMWYAFSVFQNYKTPTADGSMKTLNDPYFTLVWNNDIELPHSFRLSANAQWASKGDYNNFSITAQRFNLTLGVQRDFNLRRLGQFTLDVRCVDILNTNKTDATVYGIRELSTANPARRTFLIDLVWKFNEARSKYRGSGAGEKQKARM